MKSYEKREKLGSAVSLKKPATVRKDAVSNYSVLSLLGSGSAMPSAVQDKMEKAFGADFSNVVIHEHPIVEQYGAEAVAWGNHIAFAPGKYQPDSEEGSRLLGHELSHVVQQARGEAKGSGYLADSRLEDMADLQGSMAARGESVYTHTDAGTLSIPSMSPEASVPYQASKWDRKKNEEAATPEPQQEIRPEDREAFERALPNIPAEVLSQERINSMEEITGTPSERYARTLIRMNWRGDKNWTEKKSAEAAYRRMHDIPAMVNKKLTAAGITGKTFEKYASVSKDELEKRKDYARDVGRIHDIEGSVMEALMDEPDMQRLIRAKYQGFQGLPDKLKANLGGESGIMGALLSDLQNRMTGLPMIQSRENMAKTAQGSATLQTSITEALLNVANGRDFNELSDDELKQAANYVNRKMTHMREGEKGKPQNYANVARIKQQMRLYDKLRQITGSAGTAQASTSGAQQAPAPAKKKWWKFW